MTELSRTLDRIYNEMEGSEISKSYSERHGVNSAAVLTVRSEEHTSELQSLS